MSTDPRSWSEEAEPSQSSAAQLLATVRTEAYVDERRLAATRARLELTLAGGATAPQGRVAIRRLVLATATVATAAAAVTLSARLVSTVPTSAPTNLGGVASASSAPTSPTPRASGTVAAASSAQPAVAAGSAASSNAPAVAETHAAGAARSPTSPSGAPAADAERELFARAVAALRREGSPARALALLDEYRGEYPRGRFASDAELTRIDALVALGRNAEALKLLNRLPLERMPQSSRLRKLRAQLGGTP